MAAVTTYRPPTLDDVPAAAHCHLECWREAYSDLLTPARLAELLTIDWFLELWRHHVTGGRVVRIAVQEPEVIGFAVAGPAEEVGVQITFTLNAINARPRAFYLRNGFRPDGAERVEPFFGPMEIRMVRFAASPE